MKKQEYIDKERPNEVPTESNCATIIWIKGLERRIEWGM